MSEYNVDGLGVTTTVTTDASTRPEQVCCHVDQFDPDTTDDDANYVVYTFDEDRVREMEETISEQRRNFVHTTGALFAAEWADREDTHAFVEYVCVALWGNVDRLVRSDGSSTVVGPIEA